MSETRAPQPAVVRLEGTFDLPAARLLENSIGRMGAGSAIRVDFTRVREFKDFAVAVLAQTLRASGAANVKVEGLGLHQVRLLRYFGVAADVFRRDHGGTADGAP